MDWDKYPEKVAELQRLWATGLSAQKIGLQMGNLTKNQIVGKAHRLGLPGRESPIQLKKYVKASVRNEVAKTATQAPAPPPRDRSRKRAPQSGIFMKCQFPKGDDPATMTFCGKQTIYGPDGRRSSYCEDHHKRCYVSYVRKAS